MDENKICDDCGKCDICDLDISKICDNCGKCLGGEGEYASKAVEIDEIIEDEEIGETDNDFESVGAITDEEEAIDEDFDVELIDDIEGLRDLLENKGHVDKYTYEEFPGLIRLKKGEK
ncbi:MAG: hypothetical protein AB9844_11125 [Clostridiaceae bacterium]